jgi:hypothetical protein
MANAVRAKVGTTSATVEALSLAAVPSRTRPTIPW